MKRDDYGTGEPINDNDTLALFLRRPGKPPAPAAVVAREVIADEVERLIGLLDELDGDADLEPSLGGQSLDAAPGMVDVEGDPADDEPVLGSLDGRMDQHDWSRGWTNDAEHQDGDDEPSLGAPEHGERADQEHWARGGKKDVEHDPADLGEPDADTELNGDETDYSDHSSGMDGGIGDLDGLAEQVSSNAGNIID